MALGRLGRKRGRGEAGPAEGCLPEFAWNPQGLLSGHPQARHRQKGALRWPEGLSPGLSEPGSPWFAPFRSRSGSRGAAPLRTRRVSARGPASARIFSPCDPRALEDVIPLGSSNSSSAPLASTPPRPPLSLFGDSVPLPTREVVTAVTPLPVLATAGAPRGPAPCPGRLAVRWRRVGLASSLC